MALFDKKGMREDRASAPGEDKGIRLLPAHTVYCRICDEERRFTKCWLCSSYVTRCPCCNLAFKDPAALYRKFQPACPKCGESLEYPGFEYGICDNCGSKYELVEGAKPGLLPNVKQRKEMDKHGKVWGPD